MAEVVDPKGLTPRMVTFWASMVDCFLQDFQKAVASQDVNGVMLAAAKLEMAGSAIAQWFGGCCESAIESDEDAEAVNAAADAVATVVEKEFQELFSDEQSEGPDTIRTYN